MPTISISPSGCSRPKVVIVLIDKDIVGVEEDLSAKLDASVTYNDPDGNPVDSLSLRAYTRQSETLKYFRKAKPDEPGYDDGDLALATEVHDPLDAEEYTRYATKSFYYDDGAPFTLGEYTRSDYPDYPENDVFPPDGTGQYAHADDDFLKRRYRAVAVNRVLVTAMCKQVPPPPFAPAES